MSSQRLRPLAFDLRAVALTPEEGYVLSRIDRPVSRGEVAAVVGLPPAQTDTIIARLLTVGVLALDDASEAPASTEVTQRSGVRPRDPAASATIGAPPAAANPGAQEKRPGAVSAPPPSSMPTSRAARPPTSDPRRRSSASFAALAMGDASADGALRQSEPPGSLPSEAQGSKALYEATFRGLVPSARAGQAQHATGQELFALCHDPHPQVVLALLANPAFGAAQARVVAHHHQNVSGLELLGRNAALLADVGVQRAYLGNPRLTAALLERVLGAASLEDLHQHVNDAGLRAELRTAIGETLRSRFAAASPREIADLVYWSEGRALEWGGGAPLTEEAVARIAQRPITSEMLVTRLATYAGTPRSLLVVLDRQPFVVGRRDLRELLRQHPNAR